MGHGRKLGIIGLGYVGLPVAIAFARSGIPVIGFDIDRKRVDWVPASVQWTDSIEDALAPDIDLVVELVGGVGEVFGGHRAAGGGGLAAAGLGDRGARALLS